MNTHLFKGKFGYDITPSFRPSLPLPTRIVHATGIVRKTICKQCVRAAILGRRRAHGNSAATCAIPGNASLDGTRFDVVQSGFGGNQDKRETLNLGLQLRGALTPNWNVDTTISYFDVLKDIRATAFFNPNDPGNTGRGPASGFQEIQLAELRSQAEHTGIAGQ